MHSCDHFYPSRYCYLFFFFRLTLLHIILLSLLYCVLHIKALRADNARELSTTKPVFGWRLRDINLEPVEGCGLRVFFLFFLRRSADAPHFVHITLYARLYARQRPSRIFPSLVAASVICNCYNLSCTYLL